MVGQTSKDGEIRRALKIYIIREREKQKSEEEAEAEKARKKLELDQKKLKEETEFKATKDKLSEVTKKQDQLKQNRAKVLEHLKKLLADPTNKHVLQPEDVNKLVNFGLVVTHVNPVPSQPIYLTTVPSPVIPRVSTVSVNSQYKTSSPAPIPVQVLPAQKRNRSPSPFHPPFYKQAAGPLPFQKIEDSHRNHDYGRTYQYKPGNSMQSGNYNPFYPPTQNVAYNHPTSSVHSNTVVYPNYGASREDAIHKSQSVAPPQTQPQHSSLYPSHRSLPPGPSPSIQSSNHVSYLVEHSKGAPTYPDEKYLITRPGSHVSVHSAIIPVQQPPLSNKHGSITSGYPVRPVATQIGPQSQLHIQTSHGGHHGSSASHHPSQPQSHHPSMSHHSASSHQPSQSHLQQPPHHQQSSVHYPPHSQPQHHHSSSHSSAQPPVSGPQSHHAAQHHQPHMQPMHVSSLHPSAGSHHQLLPPPHHPSSIHHTSSQQHLQQALHHQQVLQQSQLHHQQLSQPHIQQHISSHQSQMSSQQSQPTSVVTSQAYANQMNAIQSGSRLVYSQSNIPH